MVPEKLLREPEGATAKVLPLPTDRVPLLVKPPAVVKLAPPARLKLLAAEMVAKFARPLPLVVEFSISAVGLPSVMLAVSVTMLAPGNASVPVTS